MSESYYGSKVNRENLMRKYGFLPALGAAAAAAILVDNRASSLERRDMSEEAGLETHQHPGDQAIYVLPGCRMDGKHISTMLEPQFSRFGPTNYLSYPEQGFSLDSIKQKLITAGELQPDQPATIYASSMGGMVLSKLLSDDQFRQQFGEIDKIILDSSPSGEQDIRRPIRMAMGAAALLKSSWTASRLSGQILHRWGARYTEHDPYISEDQLMEYRQITAAVPLHVTHSQSKFIRQTELEPGSLAGVANSVYYIQSEQDEIIDTERARQNYEKIFDTEIDNLVDDTRPYGSHAAGIEYQARLIELISQSKPLQSPAN